VIVLDASVLIAHFDPADALHERATHLLLEAASERLACSVVTIAEVLVGPVRAGRGDAAVAALRDLDVDAVPLDVAATERLAVLRAETGLRLPDCCVLLAAEATSAAVASFDDRLRRSAASRGLALTD
jgi:predicted nucleic acid-binding protein